MVINIIDGSLWNKKLVKLIYDLIVLSVKKWIWSLSRSTCSGFINDWRWNCLGLDELTNPNPCLLLADKASNYEEKIGITATIIHCTITNI